MTKIITRYFDDVAAARAVRHELVNRRGFSPRITHLFEEPEGLPDALTDMHVDADAARAYQTRMKSGGAVLLVQAGYKPLSVAQTTRDVAAKMGGAAQDDLVEEVRVKDEGPANFSVLTDHRLMLTRPLTLPRDTHHMADWPIGLISRRKPADHYVFPRHAHMANWPIPLLSDRKPNTRSIFKRHARMANFPIPLISRRKPYDKMAFARHAHMANFPIPLLSRRKPYRGTAIGRHPHMANWPFPLLIDGKQRTNAIIPGQPHMANFPIPLLSDRKPYTASALPSKHAHMANFPISLLSDRKPYTGSIFPRHARMADAPVPLLVDRKGPRGFSLSRMLGLPTIIRR
ncbi:PucR family transcriptional regulator [Jannaschia sp.]|nr:PucR family transcriptional regulator [Jannaschia sp.]